MYTAVDHKPKTSRQLLRLSNIRANPSVSLLVDHYDNDWAHLWWVRADGLARVVEEPAAISRGVDLLVERYAQYREQRPEGPLIDVTVTEWSGWVGS